MPYVLCMGRKRSDVCVAGDVGVADLSLLKHFVAVVNAGSFTRASEGLNLSQSVVSRSVSRLEDILGIRLLERTTRKLHLTPAGDALFTETVASLDRISVAVDDARRIGRGANASLRIGICPAVVPDAPRVQRGLLAFRAIWPDVELKFSSIISAVQPDALRESNLDLGVMLLDRPACCGLDWQVLSRAPLSVAVPEIWGLRSERLRLADLRDRPWILPDPKRSQASYQSNLATLRAAGFEPKIGGFAEDRLTAQLMLGCGIGASLVYAQPEHDQSFGYRLIPLKLAGEGNYAETIVSWAPLSSSEHISSMVGCLREAMADQA